MIQINKSYQSLNYDLRPDKVSPDSIVIHYTNMPTFEAAVLRLCDAEAKVSAHYIIDELGQIYQLVDPKYRAWHAGASYWRGKEKLNDYSIGIELANKGLYTSKVSHAELVSASHGSPSYKAPETLKQVQGDKFLGAIESNTETTIKKCYHPFPPVQIQALINLCQMLIKEYSIKPQNILGHACIAFMRKEDPGALFPWQELADNGVGIYPDIDIIKLGDSRPHGNDTVLKIRDIRQKLREIGYGVTINDKFDHELERVLEAFNNRFYKTGSAKVIDENNVNIINGLLTKYE